MHFLAFCFVLFHRESAHEALLHPFLYYYELLRKGYRYNKYEDECYTRAGNVYRGEKPKV